MANVEVVDEKDNNEEQEPKKKQRGKSASAPSTNPAQVLAKVNKKTRVESGKKNPDISEGLRLLKKSIAWGAPLLAMAYITSKRPGRRAMANVRDLIIEAGRWAKIKPVPLAKQIQNFAVEQYDIARTTSLSTLVYIVVLGVGCICGAAFVDKLFWRAIMIDVFDLGLFILVTDFWARWIPLTIGMGVAGGYIKQVDQPTFQSLSSFVSFLFTGPKQGLPEGLEWVGMLWQKTAMVTFWFILGSQYLVWVPLAQVNSLLFAALPCIAIFTLGPIIWPPKTRGFEISWILWAELFMLIDIAFLAVFKAEMYDKIVAGKIDARITMMAIIVAEVFAVITIVRRIRQPKSTGGVTVVTLTPGTPVVLPQPKPESGLVNGMIIIGLIALVGGGAMWFNKATLNNKPMIPSDWMFDGQATANVLLWVFGIIGIIGLVIWMLSRPSPRTR